MEHMYRHTGKQIRTGRSLVTGQPKGISTRTPGRPGPKIQIKTAHDIYDGKSSLSRTFVKLPTLTAISFTLTFTACVETASAPNGTGGTTAYNATTNAYNTCLRAANSGTQSEKDNLKFFRNCLHQYGLITEQRSDDTPNNDTSTVYLTKKGNSYYIPVRINDAITLPFLLDTGASDLAIPADVALTLIRAGKLKRGDFIGQTSYRMANGSEDLSDVVILRDVRVGDHMVRNVSANISPPQGEPLLGQSFLSKFGAVTVDYKRLILVLSP
jgi:clan AA aspartic protease (TIGR02281 family)